MLNKVLTTLDSCHTTAALPSTKPKSPSSSSAAAAPSSASASASAQASLLTLNPFKIKKWMEEDRKRHKRLWEQWWVQAVSHNLPVGGVPPLASILPLTDGSDGVRELTLDIEFDNEWEMMSDWNEDNDEAVADENALCFPPLGEEDGEVMDLS